ncbi:MAG: LysR family transcriptional regulator [Verrucomicrobia bacterium]|nr:LysR family transcriptional regulator [Verrucomicrobiota bacterium]
MEVHQFRYLVAVAEEGSFSRAADRMRVAQPSLSQQIQKLEAELGQPLFDRLPRGVMPTEAGRKLLPFARRILTELAEARRSVDECRGEPSGTVAVGIIPTIAPFVLRPVLSALAAEHPRLAVSVVEGVTEYVVRALEDGEVDLALVSTCRDGAAVHRELLTRERLVLAVSQSHRLARLRSVSWPELQEQSFLLLHESHCLSQQIGRWCQQHGIAVKATVSAVQLSTVLAMVAAGQGVSLMPAMAVPHEHGGGCAFVPLADPSVEREINIVYSPARFRSKAANAFAAVARRTVREVASPSAAPDPCPLVSGQC